MSSSLLLNRSSLHAMSRFSFSNLRGCLSEVIEVVRSIMENVLQLSSETIEDRRDPPKELGTERNSWLKWVRLLRQRRLLLEELRRVAGSRNVCSEQQGMRISRARKRTLQCLLGWVKEMFLLLSAEILTYKPNRTSALWKLKQNEL